MPRFTHTTGQRIQIGDATLYVEEAGDPSGTPLVLLHGGLGSMVDLNPVLDGLTGNFRFVGIDFRGHGRSTLGSEPLSYARYQSDVACVLDELGIASCAVLGLSDGGIVAYRMAAQTPARVTAIVTVGAQWRLDPDGPVFEMLSGLTGEMWAEMFPESVDSYRAVNPAPSFDTLVAAVVALWTDRTEAGYPGASVARIAAPLLIVRGDDDHLLSLQEAVDLRAMVEGARFCNVPSAGHEVHKDAPELFLAVVDAFLARPA